MYYKEIKCEISLRADNSLTNAIETDPCIYENLIYDKGDTNQYEQDRLFYCIGLGKLLTIWRKKIRFLPITTFKSEQQIKPNCKYEIIKSIQ